MRHKFFTIICMLCMFDVHGKTIKNHPSMSQASVNILSLEEAMILAQKTHPEVLETLPAKDAAMYRGHQAKALRLPVLEGRVGAGREYLRQKFSRNKLNPFPLEGSVNEKRADSTLSLRQPLFDGYYLEILAHLCKSGSCGFIGEYIFSLNAPLYHEYL